MARIFLIFVFLLINGIANSQNSNYKIEAIKAYLFYNSNDDFSEKQVAGTYSENIIDNPNIHLWNTIIGSPGGSNQTLIIIEIRSTISFYEESILKVTCKTPEKTIFEKLNTFAAYSKDGKYFHAVLIDDTGCDNIEILAEIINDKISNKVISRLVKNIPFECGE